ncbi:hypothetical protein MSAN_02116400 [Mycena sanguinolenta]|uniref:F-box domain-containing protein n=1 Tax=Mycena sanguinolenta TaxID=230812 RepID=A0A8H7CKB9_9AGAR|nr:hypothetical protein MSAN_02116400 [Mycena sanguinolenta]
MVWTRRVRKERMEISRWLPNEVLAHIMQHASKVDQAALSRVSKLFRDLCLPINILNRDVEIKGSRAITSFCLAIIENPSRADAVRSFILAVPYTNRVKIRNDLILASLKLMKRLDHLSLSPFVLDESRNRRSLVEKTNFPELNSCNIWVPRGILLEAFLARHSTLKRIHLHSKSRIIPSQSMRISLPNLEYYEGDAGFILAIDTIRLKEVHFHWHSTDDVDVEKIIIGISSKTNQYLPFISCHRYSGDPFDQIVASVSKYMQYTKTLQLQSWTNSWMLLSPGTIYLIKGHLRRFASLVYLAIGYNGFQSSRTRDQDRIAVEGWGEACPTLEGCCFHNNGWRKVDGQWEEYPIKEFWALAGIADPGY